LFQYEAGTWSDHHENLNRNNENDQIVAIYGDITDAEAKYVDAQGAGSIPRSLFFSEYFSVMHHSGPAYPRKQKLGSDSSKWKSDPRVRDYNGRAAALDFEF